MNAQRTSAVVAEPQMHEPSPFEVLRDMASAYCLTRSLHAVADLGVADKLDPASGSEPIVALASAVGANADALARVLRLLSAHGVFELDGDAVRHSPTSLLLREDHPQSARAFVRM